MTKFLGSNYVTHYGLKIEDLTEKISIDLINFKTYVFSFD